MLGAIGGGVIALVLFIATSILVYKRRKSKKVENEVVRFSTIYPETSLIPYTDSIRGG